MKRASGSPSCVANWRLGSKRRNEALRRKTKNRNEEIEAIEARKKNRRVREE